MSGQAEAKVATQDTTKLLQYPSLGSKLRRTQVLDEGSLALRNGYY